MTNFYPLIPKKTPEQRSVTNAQGVEVPLEVWNNPTEWTRVPEGWIRFPSDYENNLISDPAEQDKLLIAWRQLMENQRGPAQ